MLNERQKRDFAVAFIAMFMTFLFIVAAGVVIKDGILAKKFCLKHNGTFSFNWSGNFCDDKKLIKQNDGEFIFLPNFNFNATRLWG